MIINYLKITFRTILRNKVFSFINILGLSIGMASCLLIMLWVQNELNFDKFHSNRDKMYRVMSYGTKYMTEGFDGIPAALGINSIGTLPDIKKLTFFESAGEYFIKYGDEGYYQDNGLFADSSFFNFFNFNFLYGNKNDALKNPYSIVLDEDVAKKIFGNENPIGKTLIVGKKQRQLIVSGVIEKVPDNSTLQFKYVIPIGLLQDINYYLGWGRFMYTMFVQLDENVVPDTLAAKMTQLALDNNCGQVKDGVSFKLQEFKKLHLDGFHGSWRDFYITGDKRYVTTFSIIAAVILIIACFNYINLSTARSERRSREVAIRKVSGANRRNLITQFLGESFLVTIISLIFALILVELLRPSFNILTEKNLIINYSSPDFLIGLVIILFTTSFLAGIYPAFIMSSFSPIKVLKNIYSSKKGGSIFRKILVVLQFIIASILIICSVLIYKQINFLRNKDLGFDKENVVYLYFKENLAENYYYIKNELLKDPNIFSVSASDYLWANNSNRCSGCFQWEGYSEADEIDVLLPKVDFDFLKTLNIKIINGRDFSNEIRSDSVNAMIINETLAKSLGLDDPLNLNVKFGYQKLKNYQIIGVYKDINYSSLRKGIESQVLRIIKDPGALSSSSVMLIKINGQNVKEAINAIEKQWKSVNKFSPFEYHFLDQAYDQLYFKDKRMGQILICFTILAIFISCLGIFGLAAFVAESKTKEIGIRKVNGAKVSEIVWRMTKNFVIWIIMAFVIAIPIAWFIMDKILMNYANRISFGIVEFLLSLIIILSISISASTYQAFKAATMNPVNSLKYE